MRAEVVWDDVQGQIDVVVVRNDDPESIGCESFARGFPVCTATVDYPDRGYRSLFGWVQLVRSTDNGSGGTEFEVDPFALFGDAPSPYCWYGTAPTLFDAPSRTSRSNMRWVAHSFLAATPLREVLLGNGRMVRPLVGFSWGFQVLDGDVALHDVTLLDARRWTTHVETLQVRYPFWRFADDQER